MFGLMVSEPAVCTESGWERFLGIFKELCCTAESCFLGPALQWKCYCSRTLKHVRPSGAQQGLWSQTLFSSPMLRLPSLTFLGISEEFCSQFLIKSLQGNSGSCSCLQTGLSVTRVLCWFDNVMLITWCVCRKFAGHHRGNRGDGRLPALHEDSPRVQLHCEGNTHTQVTCWVTLC